MLLHRTFWIKALCLLMLFTFLPNSTANAESKVLTLSGPAQIRPYAPEQLALFIPAEGKLSLLALQGEEEMPLIKDMDVSAGNLTLTIDGLTLSGEALFNGDAKLIARLESGDFILEAEHPLRVLLPASALSYVILSREQLPALGGEDLYADYELAQAGELDIALYRADKEETKLRTWSLERKDTLPHAFRWDKTIAGKPADPGKYFLRFHVRGSKQGALDRAFTLTDKVPDNTTLQVTATGDFLPASLDDDSVWRAMMAPLTVLDIGGIQHQRVFIAADMNSSTLGMVHGQTAGLEVLELNVNGFARVRAARHGDGELITGFVPMSRLKVIVPDDRFGLLIDKDSQTLTVYKSGKIIGTLLVSTGMHVPPGDDFFETLSGAFLTQDRITGFSDGGFRYDYALRIDGGNLIHQTGYRLINRARDFSAQRTTLGQKVSHGCVRVDNRVSDGGISAWWLYANLPRNTKVLVVGGEDAENPAKQISSPLENGPVAFLVQEEELPQEP